MRNIIQFSRDVLTPKSVSMMIVVCIVMVSIATVSTIVTVMVCIVMVSIATVSSVVTVSFLYPHIRLPIVVEFWPRITVTRERFESWWGRISSSITWCVCGLFYIPLLLSLLSWWHLTWAITTCNYLVATIPSWLFLESIMSIDHSTLPSVHFISMG